MPVFPWRFIDSLLGRSRPGDEETATDADVTAEIDLLSQRLRSDASLAENLNHSAVDALKDWGVVMLQHSAPDADGRSRRDVNVQLGAVNGAVRAVIRDIDGAFATLGDDPGQRMAWRLRSLESEISSPLYSLEEQTFVRARLERLLHDLDRPGAPAPAVDTIPRLVAALTPPEG
jgi:hypothetical protein